MIERKQKKKLEKKYFPNFSFIRFENQTHRAGGNIAPSNTTSEISPFHFVQGNLWSMNKVTKLLIQLVGQFKLKIHSFTFICCCNYYDFSEKTKLAQQFCINYLQTSLPLIFQSIHGMIQSIQAIGNQRTEDT